jgi:Protein of unknown function (DUF616)
MALIDRVVVYTCITDGYDELLGPRILEPEVDYICFTDRLNTDPKGWTLREIPGQFSHPALANRYAKMHPHVLFPQHQLSVYIDGYIQPVTGVADFARQAAARGDIAFFEHPFRRSIFEEATVCCVIGHDWHRRIARQMRSYAAEGFPAKHALFEGGIIVRRHHTPGSIAFMEAWWQAYCSGVRRDQLSLPYVSWKTGIPVVNLGPSDARGEQRHFHLTGLHKSKVTPLVRLRGWLNRRMLQLFPQSLDP